MITLFLTWHCIVVVRNVAATATVTAIANDNQYNDDDDFVDILLHTTFDLGTIYHICTKGMSRFST